MNSPYAKAIIGGLVAAITFAIPVVTDGAVTLPDILGIVLAGLTGSGLVYAVPNRPQPPVAPKNPVPPAV